MLRAAEETCLGMVELATVPAGAEALDHAVKAASIRVLAARPITPAKYVAAFEGEVEAVRLAVAAVRDVAGDRLVDDFVLAAPHPQLTEALVGPRKVDAVDALGLVQTADLCAAVVAADGALKVAEVELVEIRLAMGLDGQGFFTVTGEISDVESALARAVELAGDRRVDETLLAAPDPEAIARLCPGVSPLSAWDNA